MLNSLQVPYFIVAECICSFPFWTYQKKFGCNQRLQYCHHHLLVKSKKRCLHIPAMFSPLCFCPPMRDHTDENHPPWKFSRFADNRLNHNTLEKSSTIISKYTRLASILYTIGLCRCPLFSGWQMHMQ